MKVFAIADLHLDSKNKKPMNIFGDNWINHDEKIFHFWKETVSDEDLVLLPGDISWAGKLEDVKDDLIKIEKLPGLKIIGKGNHDYWWATSRKLDKLNFSTIKFLKNNCYIFNDFTVTGTRGWDTMEEHDQEKEASNQKIFLRELNRFKISLEQSKNVDKQIIAMLHYPPFDSEGNPNDFFWLMKEYNVKICIYGHLHGEDGHKNIKEGLIENMVFYCVASDYLNFKIKRIL